MASIHKRGRSWYAQVNTAGIRRSRSFPLRKAAVDWAAELESAIKAGLPPHHDVTLAQVIERYQRELGPIARWGHGKAGSLHTCLKMLGDRAVRELSVEDITGFAMERRRAGISPSTILHDISTLGTVLKTAGLLWRYPVDRNLVADARYVLARQRIVAPSNLRDREISAVELERIGRNWPARAVPFDIVRFAAASCMRRSEILALTWLDLDTAARTILVRDRKHPTQKLGNHQPVPLLGEAWPLLMAQPRLEARIWPFSGRQLWDAWDDAVRAAGVQDVRFHDLRHTGITAMFRAGWQIQEVALVSGHRSWKMLQRYTHITAADLVARDDDHHPPRHPVKPPERGLPI